MFPDATHLYKKKDSGGIFRRENTREMQNRISRIFKSLYDKYLHVMLPSFAGMGQQLMDSVSRRSSIKYPVLADN